MNVIRLDNGLRCILERRKDTGVVAVQVWVRVGSRYEDDRLAGITHFIEHLIFKGTEKDEGYEIAPRIEALGGSINAFTSYDNTVYHIVIPKDAFETGFQLLTESVKSPAFPEKELEKEKKVVIEEIKMGEDDPQRKLFKELFAASYPGHPYGRPIIGYSESVSAMTRSDVLSYYRDHYAPDNMSIVVVGDFDEGRVEDLLRRQFSGIPAKGNRAEGSTAAGEGKRTRIVEKSVAETYLTISYPIGPFTHADTPALEVLSKVLSDGDSSRLQSSLKHEKRLVTDADTYLFAPKEKGLFVIMATFKGRDYETVMRGVEDELRRLSEKGLEQWEIQKARNLVRASYVYGEETVQGRARLVGNFDTLADDPDYTEKYLAAIDRIGEADIRRVLETYLTERGRSVAVLMPRKASNPRTVVLENGLRFTYNRNNASPSLAFMVGFVGGLKEESPGQNGSFTVLSRMLLRGTRDLDAQAIARRIDTLAGSLSPVSGRNVFGLSGKFLAKDLDESLGLLKTLLTETVVREDELARVKEEVSSEIRRRDDDALQYTFAQLNRQFYEGHPYARDQIGAPDEVAALRAGDVDGLYKGFVTPKGAVLALSGDIDPGRAEALVRRLFSDWKGPERVLRKQPHMLRTGREKSIEREMLQTHLVFGFAGPGLVDDDRYPVEVMNAILSGMGGRIHRKLREENPFAYAVTFFNQETYETGAIGIYIGTDRARADDVDRLVREEIEKIRKEGFSEEEVASAKRYMIGNHYIKMQTNASMASSMCLDAIYGLSPGYFKVWPGLAQKVTTDQVNEAARKYLLLERMVKIGVGPAAARG